MWTFTWFVHFELPFRLKGTEKIHTEKFSKFPSNIYSILFDHYLKRILTKFHVILSIFFIVSVSKTFYRRTAPGNYQFSDRKIRIIESFLRKKMFKGNQCDSGMQIFPWRVSWNGVYSPFKRIHGSVITI